MSVDETGRVLSAYFTDHGGQWLAESIEFHDMSQPEPYRGRDQVGAWLHHFYEEAFPGARAEQPRLVVGDGIGAADWVFRGRHLGSLMGEAPTGRVVEVPMAAIYEVDGGEIVRARLYSDSASLARQLSPAGAAP